VIAFTGSEPATSRPSSSALPRCATASTDRIGRSFTPMPTSQPRFLPQVVQSLPRSSHSLSRRLPPEVLYRNASGSLSLQGNPCATTVSNAHWLVTFHSVSRSLGDQTQTGFRSLVDTLSASGPLFEPSRYQVHECGGCVGKRGPRDSAAAALRFDVPRTTSALSKCSTELQLRRKSM
jgi:hypothetical protein